MQHALRREADGIVVIDVEGRIDQGNSAGFDALLQEALADAAAWRGVILNFASDAVYIASVGLRALMMAYKRRRDDQRIIVACHSAVIREIFEISRYDRLFPLYDTEPDAVQALSAA